jgi:hypothetical protein
MLTQDNVSECKEYEQAEDPDVEEALRELQITRADNSDDFSHLLRKQTVKEDKHHRRMGKLSDAGKYEFFGVVLDWK